MNLAQIHVCGKHYVLLNVLFLVEHMILTVSSLEPHISSITAWHIFSGNDLTNQLIDLLVWTNLGSPAQSIPTDFDKRVENSAYLRK